MQHPDRSALATAEVLLALTVVGFTVAYFGPVPWPFPSWPTIAGLPANPELLVPALLAIAVLVRAATEELTVWTASPGVLAVLTLWLAATSWYTLYTPGPGGVFFGGLLTIVVGTGLAATVLLRLAVEWSVEGDRPRPIRERLEP